jgi:hypothetical protein
MQSEIIPAISQMVSFSFIIMIIVIVERMYEG